MLAFASAEPEATCLDSCTSMALRTSPWMVVALRCVVRAAELRCLPFWVFDRIVEDQYSCTSNGGNRRPFTLS